MEGTLPRETPELQQETPEQKAGLLSSIKNLSALHAIAFSTGLAVLAGLLTYIGRIGANGSRDALCLFALDRPYENANIYLGAVVLAEVVSLMAIVGIFLRLAYLAIAYLFKKIPYLNRLKLPEGVRNNLSWLCLLVATVDGLYLSNQLGHLSDQVRGLMFRPLSELGEPWFSLLLETDRSTFNFLSLLFSLLVLIFIISSWWFVADRKRGRWRRLVAGILAVSFVVFLFSMFSYLQGALFTVDEYPVVDFTNHVAMFGHDSVPILLGQDDKMFAFLIVVPDTASKTAPKYLVYIPRTELKYVATVRMVPLYRIEKYEDMLKLQQQMNAQKQ